MVEPVVAHCPVIPLNISILLWVPRLNIAQTDSPLSGPVLQSGTDVLWAIVATNFFGAAAPFNNLRSGFTFLDQSTAKLRWTVH